MGCTQSISRTARLQTLRLSSSPPKLDIRSLGVEGLNKLTGTGIYYSATHVEALLCDERPLHVIGAGNSAGQAAMFLSRFNAKVDLIVRGSDLRKSMSSYLVERVQANSRIHVRLHSELRAVTGGRFS